MTATIKTNEILLARIRAVKDAKMANMTKPEFHIERVKAIKYRRLHKQLFGY